MSRRAGFSLLEVLVATVIMGIAVTTLIVGLSQSVRNASRLADHDRAAMLARNKMNELLLDPSVPFAGTMEGIFDKTQQGGAEAGWRAVTRPFEAQPTAGPGSMILQEVALEVWWTPQNSTRHAIQFQTYRQTRIPIPVNP
ncbi:MAG TPA: prepilin-type N-terminal cleavage/methylation domain-containing protein [Bryobacteraceae bacterium]|nr:prepilin-type N-terminal cleavage/methylation domain-containing protein [Bryobacteraceae bacterium]